VGNSANKSDIVFVGVEYEGFFYCHNIHWLGSGSSGNAPNSLVYGTPIGSKEYLGVSTWVGHTYLGFNGSHVRHIFSLSWQHIAEAALFMGGSHNNRHFA